MALFFSEDHIYKALTGLANYFKNEDPPDIKSCIHCLQTIVAQKQPLYIEIQTYIQISRVLLEHTRNYDHAQFYLDKAIKESECHPDVQNVQMECANLLAKVLIKKKDYAQAIIVLQKIMINCTNCYPRWQFRNLFLLSQIQLMNKDYMNALEIINRGIATATSIYLKTMFKLCKAMILLMQRRFEEASLIIGECEQIFIEDNELLTEVVKVFTHILQVYVHLITGKAKTVKPILRSLQHSVQRLNTLSANVLGPMSSQMQDYGYDIIWMSKDNLCILVYLITVMHSVLIGQMEKANKYTEKAIMHIDKLRMLTNKEDSLISIFEIMLFENTTICHLIMGNKKQAIQKIGDICRICKKNENLQFNFCAQIHTQLGLYAMSMNCIEEAEMQFKKALEVTLNSELWVFVNLNLAIIYLRSNRNNDLLPLMQSLQVANLNNSQSLISSHFYVKGLQAFFAGQYSDAKRFLKESLRIANLEDLKRLTSLSLVLLGHILMSSGGVQDAMNLVQPGLVLAFKIPDVHVKLWASALLKDLFRLLMDNKQMQESTETYEDCSNFLLDDHFKSSTCVEHYLIKWIDGPCPDIKEEKS